MTSPGFPPLLPSRLRTRTLMFALFMIAFVTVIACYISITRHAGLIARDHTTVVLLVILAILALSLAAIVIYRGIKLWASLKNGLVGSRLQTRLVAVFSIIAILPAAIVSIFSAFFFNLGIESWFDDRVSTALEESVRVAETYLEEHKYTIRGDAIAMAGDIEREIDNGNLSPALLSNIVNTQTLLRSLSDAVLFQPGHIIAQSRLSFALTFEHIPAQDMDIAGRGDVVVTLDGQDKVRALIKLKSVHAADTYLLISRIIDGNVVHHMDKADGSVQQYRMLKANITGKQIQFSIAFIVLAMLLLLAAIWYGMYFASRLIMPVTRLVNAAERVRAGDLSARVAEGAKHDEIATLGRAFNRMTSELEKQRSELVEANRQLDTRRRFSEAVLSGVSAGVLAISADRKVTLANPVAASLLLLPGDYWIKGNIITDIVPEFSHLFATADATGTLLVNEDITINRSGKSRVLHVRIGVERQLDRVESYVVTFDDITDLLAAQRVAAWSDVARRVAHEIKNPLTPIQLAAERLKKKYLPQITVDSENYLKYIDTISRHVADIGRIVEEFVSFGRMPAPALKQTDIITLIRKSIFSEQTTHSDITYHTELPDNLPSILCDEQQISRVLLNLMKNAAESLETGKGGEKTIHIQCHEEDNMIVLRISDNGFGFPADKINRLFEPYMTTRSKGTGLGLAIVKKIIDDHKGQVSLENLSGGGACVTVRLPYCMVRDR